MSFSKTSVKPQLSERLVSIDALRGFDMFWIIGGDALFNALARAGKWPIQTEVEDQLEHVHWEGFHFYDLIFPLFLFLVGVVLPFSMGKLLEHEVRTSKLYWRIFRRAILLFVLGLVYNGLFNLDWLVREPSLHIDLSKIRIAGVLQRIAICYLFASLIMLNFSIRAQMVLSAVLLVGYWALLAFVPVPGVSRAQGQQNPQTLSLTGAYWSEKDSLAGYVDRRWLPGKHVNAYYEFGDNEGLLSTIPAIVTALLGALAGQWLRSLASPWRKVLGLLIAGVVCLGLGLLWSRWFPIIKNIWTSSFVLVAGGWSLLLLAFFYAVIDVIHFRWWAFVFIVIGANAITIYLAKEIIPFDRIAAFFLGGAAKHAKHYGPVVLTAGTLVVEWLFLLYLYRRRIYLRV